MDRSSREKINKETQALNDTIDQTDITDTNRTFHPKAAECVFFSSAHRTLSRTDYILGQKSSLSKIKNIEILSSMFSTRMLCDQNINYKKNTAKI